MHTHLTLGGLAASPPQRDGAARRVWNFLHLCEFVGFGLGCTIFKPLVLGACCVRQRNLEYILREREVPISCPAFLGPEQL
jgi:hypothetical protein